jgi:hypothetical protein
MNDVLRPFLRHFVLIFFDDILIYSKSWADHLRHLRVILTELRRHVLFIKCSKCAFGVSSVAYLDHIISEAGIAMDPAKVQAIQDWPVPRLARALRGFLGLAGYYRKFIHNYGSIAAPLTVLLKKDGFSWGEEAAATFATLKAAVPWAPSSPCRISPRPSSSCVMPRRMDSGQCSFKTGTRSPSSAGPWPPATVTSLHMSVSS